MILVLDIGNTHTHIGLFTRGRLRATWKLSTDPRRTADEYVLQIRGILGEESASQGAILCSVVPRVRPTLSEAIEKACHVQPMVLEADTEIGILNAYRIPAEVGMDRLANAVGGSFFIKPPILILDYGTAITLDFVDEPEHEGGSPIYRGGAIMPGIEMAAEALARGTAKLPTIDFSEPAGVIGETTAESIRSGLMHGYLGAVETLVGRARDEIGKPVRVIATGGDALRFKDRMPFVDRIEPDLTLFGLRQVYGIKNDCRLNKP